MKNLLQEITNNAKKVEELNRLNTNLEHLAKNINQCIDQAKKGLTYCELRGFDWLNEDFIKKASEIYDLKFRILYPTVLEIRWEK